MADKHEGWSSWNPNAAMEQVALDLERAGEAAMAQRYYATASALDWLKRMVRDWLAKDAKRGPTDEPASNAPAHECPYGGRSGAKKWNWEHNAYTHEMEWTHRIFHCGEDGWLCDRCKADMADARQRELFAFSKDLDAKRVAEIRAVTTHQIAERFEEVSLRLDDTWKHFDERLSALEAAFAAHGKPYGGD